MQSFMVDNGVSSKYAQSLVDARMTAAIEIKSGTPSVVIRDHQSEYLEIWIPDSEGVPTYI